MNEVDETTEQQIEQRFQVVRHMGDTYTHLGDYDEAQGCYREAVALMPARAEPHVGLGVLYLNQGLPDDAMSAFKRALECDGTNADALSGVAMVYQHKGNYALAFDWYLKSLEADTDSLVSLLGLFQSACQMGTFEKVIHYLEIYREMHPADTCVLFCLATLYQREGRGDRALDLLERVVLIDPAHQDAAAMLRGMRDTQDVAQEMGGLSIST